MRAACAAAQRLRALLTRDVMPRVCGCSDCTHFCYTPQFWKAFFHNVYEAHEAVAAATGGR
jgi:hypothetical protein